MSLQNKSAAVKRHIKVFRENDALAVAGTGVNGPLTLALPQVAGFNVLPDPTDPGWIDLDIVEEHEDKPVNEKKVDIHAGVPGFLTRADQLTTMRDMETTGTLARISPMVFEAFYGSNNKLSANSYQFVPMSIAPRRVWCAFVDYDGYNVQTVVGNIFGVFRITGGMKGGKGDAIMPTFSLEWLYSVLQTMGMGSYP